MKLISYTHNGSRSCGILLEDGILDIPANVKDAIGPRSVLNILRLGPRFLTKISEQLDFSSPRLDLKDVSLLPPVVKPGKLFGLAGNYMKHIKETGGKLGLSESPRSNTVPRPFLMPSTVLTSPNSEIPWPAYSEQIDYEIELAVVIGSPADCISPDEAAGHIAGYTIANDVSARSVTFAENRKTRPWDEFFDWLNGKWANGFLPLGPCLVTTDEIDDPADLTLELKVNGRLRQQASTNEMIFSVSQIVSFLSHLTILEPGDIIATGTPAGVGMASGNFLQPGDTIECTISGIGTLSNTLGPAPKDFYKPLTKA